MILKKLLGTTEDGLLNISSPKLTDLMAQLNWSPIKTTGQFYVINYSIVTYGDADVWYLIAKYNGNIENGIAPANATVYVPTFQSLINALNSEENVSQSQLGTEVLI